MARRGYLPEFRRRVVDLVGGGRKVSEVADTGVAGRWNACSCGFTTAAASSSDRSDTPRTSSALSTSDASASCFDISEIASRPKTVSRRPRLAPVSAAQGLPPGLFRFLS